MTSPPRAAPALVATDLDGTFVRSDGSISARTAAVWTALPDVGVETVIVTARPPRWLHTLEDVVGPHGRAICGNGAFVYDVARREILETHTFDVDLLAELIGRLRAAVPGASLGVECAGGARFDAGFPDLHQEAGSGPVRRVGADDLVTESVGKLLALAPGMPRAEFFALVEQVVGERGQFAYSGAGALAEISPPGVTKAAALDRWCARRDIDPARTWAFGDMPNDLPMLAWAGVGFAVANAHPDVLAAADAVCPANDDDGVAHTLAPLLTPAPKGSV